eukprot:COSAG06_NODE_1889_length_8134_cov_3.277785_2_plen_55_part_00
MAERPCSLHVVHEAEPACGDATGSLPGSVRLPVWLPQSVSACQAVLTILTYVVR